MRFTTYSALQAAVDSWCAGTWPNTEAPMNAWDVSDVLVMPGLFRGKGSCNIEVSAWDVSKVGDMSSMFAYTTSFNDDLSSWDTSRVTTMRDMFQGATAFNSVVNTWDVTNVGSMYGMFHGASSFNQPLWRWNVVKVTNTEFMFDACTHCPSIAPQMDDCNKAWANYLFLPRKDLLHCSLVLNSAPSMLTLVHPARTRTGPTRCGPPGMWSTCISRESML